MILFNGALGGSFTPSLACVIVADRFVLEFEIVVGTLASVEWYAEFLEDTDPNASTPPWARECAEITDTSGNVHMPKVVRDFQENGGTGLAIGTHRISVPLVRTQKIARVQLRAASGAASVKLTTPFGIAAVSGPA